MSKTITLKKVPTGGIFTLDGVRFVKLDEDYEATLVLTEKELLENIPFEAEDADREDHNNYFGSFIDRHIEKWVRDSHKPIFDATVERPIDLTTMDGMKDYGNPLVVGRILTIDEYRKYRHLIPLVDNPYWLATGWTTASSPRSFTDCAYRIFAVGTVDYNYVYNACFAARPAFYLKSEILVSYEDDEESKSLEDYTELELLAELQRRVQK